MKKNKKFDAVKMKRELQKHAEKKLSRYSEQELIEMLRKKYAVSSKRKDAVHNFAN